MGNPDLKQQPDAEKSPLGSSHTGRWQFSIKGLMFLMLGFAITFGLARILLPRWPEDWPKTTAVMFAVWTVGIGTQIAAMVWWLGKKPDRPSENRRAWFWSAVPITAWLTLAMALVFRPDDFGFREWWPSFFGVAAIHLLPPSLAVAVQHFRRVCQQQPESRLVAVYGIIAANMMFPSLCSLAYAIRAWVT